MQLRTWACNFHVETTHLILKGTNVKWLGVKKKAQEKEWMCVKRKIL